VLIRPPVVPEGSSVELSVGAFWFDCEKEKDYRISDSGLEIRPNGFVVIETKETIALPCNIFGLLTGKGALIFRGILISPSKIDPTFHDKLRIGVFNAGRVSVTFKTGEALCSCCFFMMEAESRVPISRTSFGPRVLGTRTPVSIRLARLVRDPIVILICTALTALGTILSAIFAYATIHLQH